MNEPAFLREAKAAGFDDIQAAFMWHHLAQRPHMHNADEIVVDPQDGETLSDFVSAVSEALEDETEDEEETVG